MAQHSMHSANASATHPSNHTSCHNAHAITSHHCMAHGCGWMATHQRDGQRRIHAAPCRNGRHHARITQAHLPPSRCAWLHVEMRMQMGNVHASRPGMHHPIHNARRTPDSIHPMPLLRPASPLPSPTPRIHPPITQYAPFHVVAWPIPLQSAHLGQVAWRENNATNLRAPISSHPAPHRRTRGPHIIHRNRASHLHPSPHPRSAPCSSSGASAMDSAATRTFHPCGAFHSPQSTHHAPSGTCTITALLHSVSTSHPACAQLRIHPQPTKPQPQIQARPCWIVDGQN